MPEPDGYPFAVGTDGVGDAGEVNNSGIVSFYFHRDGTIGMDTYTYDVTKEDDKFILSYRDLRVRNFDYLTHEIGQDILNALHDIYVKYEVYKWDGFDKRDTQMCDGSGFSMSIGFADGKGIRASGMNCFPDGIYDFREEVKAVFAPVVKEMLEEAKAGTENETAD